MINQIIITGRLAENPKIEKTENGTKRGRIKINCTRSYKNANGEYETDTIPCILWRGVAEQTAEYCKTGDLIGIRGRIQITNEKIELIAEKVSFLASKKEEE